MREKKTVEKINVHENGRSWTGQKGQWEAELKQREKTKSKSGHEGKMKMEGRRQERRGEERDGGSFPENKGRKYRRNIQHIHNVSSRRKRIGGRDLMLQRERVEMLVDSRRCVDG